MNIARLRLAALPLLLCAVVSCGKEVRTISTPSGSVEVTKEPAEPVPQHFELLPESELSQVESDAARAKEFLNAYVPGAAGSLADFDKAFLAWQREARHRFSSKDVIAMLGAQLGQRLVSELDMEWVVVTDQYGRDVAVRSKQFEVISFPFASVAKRVESGQYEFMEGIYYAVQEAIKNGNYKAR